tara:strand:+ start:363 stop:533 length:171 start_codon:yes stop_codon:yes gene_type:complete
MDELKINRGVEFMLRRADKKVPKPAPKKKGFHIKKIFILLKRKFYLNFEFRWESHK